MKCFLAAMAFFAMTAFGADIAGTWKGTAETENGTLERTFVFKVEGDKLTGETTSSMLGKSTIENGKVDGDKISFTINAKFQDNDMKLEYKGEVKENEMVLKVEVPNGGPSVEYKAKKIS
ncbi:MAG TPA: hypothetical protein VEX68_22335 [Bryobacteraceae bacterium]|nr:hypothetical protein [Bryobacteraceae bacterium]